MRLWDRICYPISNPQQVLGALGIQSKTYVNFQQFLQQVVTRSPRRLFRRMPRAQAEKAFSTAYKKEGFHHMTIMSYYFCQGWLEFILEFDPRDHLRRLYVQHRLINSSHTIELELPENEELHDSRAPASEVSCEIVDQGLMHRLLQRLTFTRR